MPPAKRTPRKAPPAAVVSRDRDDTGPSYGLDQLREDIERDYAPFRFGIPGQDPAVFLPVLRLPKERRDLVFDLIGKITDQGEADGTGNVTMDADRVSGLLDVFGKLFKLLGQGDSADRFFVALDEAGLGDDPAALLTVWQQYSEVAMPGEASPSAG